MGNPLELTARHWKRAQRKNDPSADCMYLATVDGRGKPSCRTVLIKGIDERGFHFVTQSHGPKARDLARDATVEMCMNWMSIALQIRVRGRAVKMPDEEVEELWTQRHRDAQILYHLGLPQSKVIPSFRWLLQKIRAGRKRWQGFTTIPRSTWYVGYIIRPTSIEIFSHSARRLNERKRFTKSRGRWKLKYLAP